MSIVSVFVLDTKRKPLAPCHPAIARKLLKQGKAAVFRRYPFTIILKQEIKNPSSPPQRLKLDPGSKVTGLAILSLVNDATGKVVFAAELHHRGEQIKAALFSRRAVRRSRRSRKTRYRQPRFSNRRRSRGRKSWLPPSLESRLRNIETWVRRLRKLCPIQAISLELVYFDTQKLQNPEILSVEYQQGELFGYEVRKYLLLRWGRKCAYCQAKDIPLEIEHIVPKSRGGSDRVSNLTLSCQPCNQKKGNQTAEEFGYPEVQAQAKRALSLKDVAAVNATRWEIYHQLLRYQTELSIEVGSGGRTKFNRIQRGLPKTHWIDAACVGASTPETLKISSISGIRPLHIVACGYGNRQMCRVDRFGFPRTRAKRKKRVHGFQTGDLVQATIPSGKKAGTYIGRVAVRSSGNFNIKTQFGLAQGISYRYCHLLQGIDGYYYEYERGKAASSPTDF